MGSESPAAAPTVWTKVVSLYQRASHLSPGDPDGQRLYQANSEGWVLHALLADGWTIKEITPVTGGPAFAVMEKEAEPKPQQASASGNGAPVAPPPAVLGKPPVAQAPVSSTDSGKTAVAAPKSPLGLRERTDPKQRG